MTARTQHILVIDDEPHIRRALREILTSRGYDVAEAATGQLAIDMLMEGTPDLIVLDLSLPDIDGVELCRKLRTWLEVPIVVLSVRADESDKISALETGADDYLTKPFSAGELVARIKALLRRSGGATVQPVPIEVDGLVIDLVRHEVIKDGERVTLTPTEFDILAMIAQNADRLVTWNQLASTVWGPDAIVDTRTVRVHVSNLRRKIEPHPTVPRYVLTEPGVGLRFNTR